MSRHRYVTSIEVDDDRLAAWKAELEERGVEDIFPGPPEKWQSLNDFIDGFDALVITRFEVIDHYDGPAPYKREPSSRSWWRRIPWLGRITIASAVAGVIALIFVFTAEAHRGLEVGTPNPDELVGHRHGDDIIAKGGNDIIEGREGPDFLAAGRGDDLVLGGKGSDYLSGMGGYDALSAGRGNDFVQDLYGVNAVKCGPGYDVVRTNTETVANVDVDCEEVFTGSGDTSRRVR